MIGHLFSSPGNLRASIQKIFDDPRLGVEARKLFHDAEELLDQIVAENLLTAKGVYGFWPANSAGDDIIVYTDELRTDEQCRFHALRQQWQRKGQDKFTSLADFIAPVESGRKDFIGCFAVTTGIGCDELAAKFDADHDDYNSIMVKALADRLAEAFAEGLHRKVRREWGYGREESLSSDELIAEKYRGIRPAPGYPAQPDHTEKKNFVRTSRRGAVGWHSADRKFCNAPGGQREWTLFCPSRGSLLCGRPPLERSSGRLCPPQRPTFDRGRALAFPEFGLRTDCVDSNFPSIRCRY